MAQEHTTLGVALRNSIENHAWHETAVVGGKLLAVTNNIASGLKEIDAALVETMQRHHSEELAAITGKYPVQRTAAQLIAEAESAVQAAAKVVPHIDAAKLIQALRGEGQAKAKK